MTNSITQKSSHYCFNGEQRQYAHRSSVLQSEMHFSVFLPPEETRSERVLLWLSGLTCTDQNFVTKAGAQGVAAELGMTIICPDTSPRGLHVADDEAYDLGQGAGFYVNATQMPWSAHYQMYDYINLELYEIVQSHFSKGQKLAIAGHSMGGHGALISALKEQDKYLSCSAFSPIVNPVNCAWGQKAFSHYLGDDKQTWAQYDACELAKQSLQKVTMPMLVDQGLADEFFESQHLSKGLENIESLENLRLRYHEGYDHSYFFIASFIEEHLRFHDKHLRKTVK